MQLSCIKGLELKRFFLSIIILSGLLYAQDSKISYEYGIKDYKNSASKIDGKVENLILSHKIYNHQFFLAYQGDNVDRTLNPITSTNRDLEVDKYSAKYIYTLNDKIDLKASYVKIIDNQAPTDQGKIYGFGGSYNITKGLNSAFTIYKSDYKTFDVNQYDLSISKGFKLDKIKLKITTIAKKISIDGDKYGAYTFKDKDYFTTGLKLSTNYEGFIAGIATFLGKREFTVLDDGMKVQHHAIEQDKTYMLSLGKKFKDFDIIAKYSFQKGKELPENRDNVDTKIVSISFAYRF
jgi:hypothetical protein